MTDPRQGVESDVAGFVWAGEDVGGLRQAVAVAGEELVLDLAVSVGKPRDAVAAEEKQQRTTQKNVNN